MGGQRLKNANAWEAAHQPMDKEFNTSTAKIGCRERESAMPSSDQCPAIGRSLTAEIRRLRRGVMRRSLKLLQRAFPWFQTQQSLPPMPALLRRRVERAGRPRIPSPRCFRVVYVVISGISDAACMRYRAYNIMEALRKVGVESECRDYRVLSNRPSELLAFDLIVLVRRPVHRKSIYSSSLRETTLYRSSAISMITCLTKRSCHTASTCECCRPKTHSR